MTLPSPAATAARSSARSRLLDSRRPSATTLTPEVVAALQARAPPAVRCVALDGLQVHPRRQLRLEHLCAHRHHRMVDGVKVLHLPLHLCRDCASLPLHPAWPCCPPRSDRSIGGGLPYLGAALGAGPEPKQLRLGDTHSHEESNIFIKQILMFMSPAHMNDLLMTRTTFDDDDGGD